MGPGLRAGVAEVCGLRRDIEERDKAFKSGIARAAAGRAGWVGVAEVDEYAGYVHERSPPCCLSPRRTATTAGFCGKDARSRSRGCRMRCNFRPTLSARLRSEHPRRGASRCDRRMARQLSRGAPGSCRDRHQSNGPSVWVPRSLDRLLGLSQPCAWASAWEPECTPQNHRGKPGTFEHPPQYSQR